MQEGTRQREIWTDFWSEKVWTVNPENGLFLINDVGDALWILSLRLITRPGRMESQGCLLARFCLLPFCQDSPVADSKMLVFSLALTFQKTLYARLKPLQSLINLILYNKHKRAIWSLPAICLFYFLTCGRK